MDRDGVDVLSAEALDGELRGSRERVGDVVESVRVAVGSLISGHDDTKPVIVVMASASLSRVVVIVVSATGVGVTVIVDE